MDEENLVVKSNHLIEYKGKISLLEQKLVVGLVSEITVDDKDFKTYSIDLSDFKKKVKSSSNSFYLEIERAANNLMDKRIRIENKEEVIMTRYLSSVRYHKNKAILDLRFDPLLKPYLLELAGEYTKYQLKNILELKSSYSLRVYELIKQWESVGKRVIKLADLREYLGIDTEYKRMCDFERRVLKVAEKEITEKTDLWLEYDKVKKGRLVEAIEFRFGVKEEDTEDAFIEAFYGKEELEDIKKRCGLEKEKFNNKQISKLYEIAHEQTDNFSLDPYEYVKLNYEKMMEKKPRNKFSYLKKALENDYANARLIMLKIALSKK